MTTKFLPRTNRGNPKPRHTSALFDYWAERIEHKLDDLPEPREYQERNSLQYRGDTIYHYGSHFPLAEIIRSANGRARIVLLNGDSYGGANGWGPSTASRQAEVRGVVERTIAGTNVQSIILPFSVLDAAGIGHDSIKPVHIRPDRQVREERHSSERPHGDPVKVPSGRKIMVPETRYGYVNDSGEVFDNWATGSYRPTPEGFTHRAYTVDVERDEYVIDPNQVSVGHSGHGWPEGPAVKGEDGVWRWTISHHYLGDSVFRAKVRETRWRKATAEELEVYNAWQTYSAEQKRLDDKLRRLTGEYQHALHGRDEWDRVTRHYVRAAEPNPERASELERELEACREEYSALERPAKHSVVSKGGQVSYEVNRWATFLSSFDYQEADLYFMAELPYAARGVRTVEEAIEALKPPEVVDALNAGLEVKRQGDIFAIPTAYTTNDLKAYSEPFTRTIYTQVGERWEHVPHLERIASHRLGDKESRVLKTNHAGTHVIHTHDGETFAKGRLYHTPEGWGRRPEHRVVKLGDGQTWHRLVRNTVPESRGGSSFGVGVVPRAWSVSGNVD